MNTYPLNLGSDKVPNRLHQQKNSPKKWRRISSLLRARVTGSSTQTDTKSLVSVAVSQGLIRSATHSATDQQFTPAESAGNAKVAKEGEGVSNVAGGGNRKSDFARTKFSTNAHLVVGCSELEGKQEGHASWCAERRGEKR